MDSKMEETFISFVTDITFLFSSTEWNSEEASLITQLFSVSMSASFDPFCFEDKRQRKMMDIYDQLERLKPKVELVSLIDQIRILRMGGYNEPLDLEWKVVLTLIVQIIFLVGSMDLNSESELISNIKKTVSLFNSKPDSESELVSLITGTMSLGLGIPVGSDSAPTQECELLSLMSQLVSLKSETELTSLVRRIISRFRSMDWEPMRFISYCPQEVQLQGGKFCEWIYFLDSLEKRRCVSHRMDFSLSTREIYFHCKDCNGKNHEEYDKALDVKHPLHPKHSLQLVVLALNSQTRKCYCCDEDIGNLFYYCWDCDFAMNKACVEKPPRVLSIDHPKWHDHPLALFPSQASFPCNLCALTHSSCPFYICPPCDFVAHQKCLNLPRVIRISRHLHRISFTPFFDKGDMCCQVCRRKMNNDFGGYSCIKDSCSYVAHSRCATQINLWDGEDLEGVPEEIEEEVVEPFVRISNGIIQHFSHQQHYLELDENTGRDYDENKLCQICLRPIYVGNLYSCMDCEFNLHETCAHFSRKLHSPIHPHLLTLVGGFDVTKHPECLCSACKLVHAGGFSYECRKEGCSGIKLHVECATTFEPLVHESHMHPLFLTSKPGEQRVCSVCNRCVETFNCIEDECEYSLCFGCATYPQKVRYKHDKHILTLCYGEATSIPTYWCETCERQINPKGLFYKCDEYCCVTLHMRCLIGKHYRLSSSSLYFGMRHILNNQSPPLCFFCKKLPPYKVVLMHSELEFCCPDCILEYEHERFIEQMRCKASHCSG